MLSVFISLMEKSLASYETTLDVRFEADYAWTSWSGPGIMLPSNRIYAICGF